MTEPAAPSEPSAQRQVVPSLSPSRTNDFLQCPLLFRFRVIDRLPEPPSSAAKRGTLVHAVIEKLYDAPLGSRSRQLALDLLPGQWEKMLQADPGLLALFEAGGDAQGMSVQAWLDTAASLIGTYFTLEDPNRLQPAGRELWISQQLDKGGPLLRGIIDRLDVNPDGLTRVVDYKTGKSPRPGYDGSVLFQMRFYALMLWKQRGVVPAMLQLIYLGDGQILRAQPRVEDLEHTEMKIRNIWDAITDAAQRSSFAPQQSKLCGWCSFQALCPAFGGQAPALEPEVAAHRLGLSPAGEQATPMSPSQ